MRDSWRHFVAEFIGTFALVFVGGAAIMTAQMSRSEDLLLTVAVAHGLILAVLVTATKTVLPNHVKNGVSYSSDSYCSVVHGSGT